MLMGNMITHLVDVNSAFLLGESKPDKKIYMKFPHGFKKFYLQGGLLFLKRTLSGVKNAAKVFWRLLRGTMYELGYQQNCAIPCLY